MSPLYKILLVITHATSVALIMIPQVLPSFALAKTIARSSQSRNMAVHYVKERSVRVLRSKNSKVKAVVSHNSRPNPANVSYHPEAHSSHGSHVTAGAYGRSGDININTIVNDIDVLNGHYVKTYNNAQTLKSYSSQASASKQKGKYKFQQNCASALTDFHTNSRGFTTALHRMSAYKGLAYYDEYDPLETLLKNIIDTHKNALGYVNDLIACDPQLGPILGPIVYDIKCILDEILDAIENLTDAIIAACRPSMRQLIGVYSLTACKSGIEVIGMCI